MLTMYMVGTATSFVFWIIANVLNGIVLAFATYAAAGGVIAVFYGENTQKAFGVVGGMTALLVAAWMAATSGLLHSSSRYTPSASSWSASSATSCSSARFPAARPR